MQSGALEDARLIASRPAERTRLRLFTRRGQQTIGWSQVTWRISALAAGQLGCSRAVLAPDAEVFRRARARATNLTLDEVDRLLHDQ
jgi:hypothetical protein